MIALFLLVVAGIQPAMAQPGSVAKKIGSTTVTFVSQCAKKQPGISWVHVHENENTAIVAAKAIIDSAGIGCYTTWKHNGDRYVSYQLQGKQYKFDPNRIYTSKGLEATLKANGAFSKQGFKAAQQLSHFFIGKYVDGNKLIVALHNNSDGGGLTIKGYLPGGEYANDAAEVNVNEAEDIDDFFYTTSKPIYDYLKAKGFNILLQNNATVTDDGSLSVYCGYKGMDYLNIEAQVGHLQEQKRMMLAVYEMIGKMYP